MQGLDGRFFPLAWCAKFQGSSSTHTCESETVALNEVIKREVIPIQSLMEKLLGRPVEADLYEDNAACITSVTKGYSPAMRYIGRTQKVQLGFLHDVCHVESGVDGRGESRGRVVSSTDKEDKPITLKKVVTTEQKADIFTKELDKIKFRELSSLSLACDPRARWHLRWLHLIQAAPKGVA